MQFEFPWVLGPADGRYVLRADGGEQPEWIVALTTVAARASRPRRGRRQRPTEAEAEPELVPTSRATVIDPVPAAGESQARAWLDEVSLKEAEGFLAALNRVLHAHRIATADPQVSEVIAAVAMLVRGGYGEGEQVGEGRWRDARELPAGRAVRGPRRAAALRPQEHLAALLGARHPELVCEELTLDARLNLDRGRPRQAALLLRAALAAALAELHAGATELPAEATEPPAGAALGEPAQRSGEPAQRSGEPFKWGGGPVQRRAELAELTPMVDAAAQAALAGPLDAVQLECVEHALGRLEAALRARMVGGL